MSTLRNAIKIGADENNAVDNLRNIQVSKKIIEPTRRAALGELGNRPGVTLTLKGKDGQVKDNFNKDAKQVNLRNLAKPRVDTHWKKTSVLVTKTITTKTETVQLQKLNNVKSLVAATSATAVNKQSTETTVRTRAATKVITSKPPAIIITKPKDEIPTLRREDSHLSRLAITKLRTALAKDSKKDSNVITSNGNKISKDSNEKLINNDNINEEKLSTKIIIKNNDIQQQRVNKIQESEVISHSVQMLNLIENIDKNDNENVAMVPEYVNDIYSYLYNVELLLPIDIDFMKKQHEVTPRMRSVLLDWISEVTDQFHLIPETYQMTVSIIDRYLQAVSSTTRKNLQLVGAAAIFIAAKYEELFPPDISDFVYITDSTYTKSQILKMEIKILQALDFQLYRPVPLLFLRRFSKAGNAETEHYICSKYILELVSIEYSLAHYRPSEIAASALYLSMQLFNKNEKSIDKLWTPTLQYYSCYNIEHLQPIVKKIAKIVYNAPQAKQKAVYKKFQTNKFDKISTHSELYGPVISKIISLSSE